MADEPGGARGVSIPGYEVERELGRGGFAVVYRAEQPKLRRTVALKVLTNVDPSDEEAKRRFEAECQAIGSLSWHPHVVTVYDAGATEEGLPFLAMEHLPSGSLQAKLGDHGKAPWEEVLRVAVQMCDALGAAHQAGILHRDIKPANVLTSRIGDYKLADFGIARFGDSQRTATGVITGTVAYTAPEVLRGARASSASDIYALGAMLCAVASGRTPFVKDVDESVVAIMYRVNTDDPPSLAEHDVPDDLALLIHTLMDKDPEKRPASAVEVAQWAQAIQEAHGLPTVPLHTDPELMPALPPAAIAAGAVLGGAAAGAAGAAAAAAPPSPPTPPPAPAGYPSATPPPPPAGTPAPAAYGTPAPAAASYTPPPQPAYGTPAPQAAWGDTTGAAAGTGTYGASTGSYGPPSGYTPAPQPTGGGGGGGGGGKVVALVAVVALVLVILIVAIAALVGGGDDSADSTTTTTEATTTTEDESTSTTEATTSTTEGTTTTTTEGGGGTDTSDDYPAEFRSQFLNSCNSTGGNEDYCTCFLEGLEEQYTLAEVTEQFADLGSDPTQWPPELQALAAECI
jgi:hypothetical protein